MTIARPGEVADRDRIFFGAWVTLEDEKGEDHRYRLVGPDEFDPALGLISVVSPMGRVLLGKEVGGEGTGAPRLGRPVDDPLVRRVQAGSPQRTAGGQGPRAAAAPEHAMRNVPQCTVLAPRRREQDDRLHDPVRESMLARLTNRVAEGAGEGGHAERVLERLADVRVSTAGGSDT